VQIAAYKLSVRSIISDSWNKMENGQKRLNGKGGRREERKLNSVV
jgi:hypothetical protein